MSQLSDYTKYKIIFLHEQNVGIKEIGRRLNIARNTVRLWLRRYGDTGTIQRNRPGAKPSGRITLGYWGWMSSMGPGELVEVGGRFNSSQYLEILHDVMLPPVRIAYPNTDIYFVQDNCSIHRAGIVQNWLAAQEGVTVINWPSKSPDLNPIENLWGQMVLNWDTSEVRTRNNLAEIVSSTWELMRGTDLCWNMVCGMRSCLQQVIEGDGAPLRY